MPKLPERRSSSVKTEKKPSSQKQLIVLNKPPKIEKNVEIKAELVEAVSPLSTNRKKRLKRKKKKKNIGSLEIPEKSLIG